MNEARETLRPLNKLDKAGTVIVGIGHPLKGDDALGPTLCRKLKEENLPVPVIDAGSAPENHIQKIVKLTPQNLIIIDSIDFGDQPGAIRLFEPEELKFFAFSTHSLSPHLFTDMLKRQIEVEIYIIGVQPKSFELNQPLSVPVQNALEKLAEKFSELFGK